MTKHPRAYPICPCEASLACHNGQHTECAGRAPGVVRTDGLGTIYTWACVCSCHGSTQPSAPA